MTCAERVSQISILTWVRLFTKGSQQNVVLTANSIMLANSHIGKKIKPIPFAERQDQIPWDVEGILVETHSCPL